MDDEDELPIETIGWVGRNMMIGYGTYLLTSHKKHTVVVDTDRLTALDRPVNVSVQYHTVNRSVLQVHTDVGP